MDADRKQLDLRWSSPRASLFRHHAQVLMRHEMRCLYLRPLPLRERAVRSFNKTSLGEGVSSLNQAKTPPHPIERAARPVQPSPARGESANVGADFLTR